MSPKKESELFDNDKPMDLRHIRDKSAKDEFEIDPTVVKMKPFKLKFQEPLLNDRMLQSRCNHFHRISSQVKER